MTLPDVVDRAACIAAFGDWQYPMLKHADDPRFARDADVEAMTPVTMFPAGWWRRW